MLFNAPIFITLSCVHYDVDLILKLNSFDIPQRNTHADESHAVLFE